MRVALNPFKPIITPAYVRAPQGLLIKFICGEFRCAKEMHLVNCTGGSKPNLVHPYRAGLESIPEAYAARGGTVAGSLGTGRRRQFWGALAHGTSLTDTVSTHTAAH